MIITNNVENGTFLCSVTLECSPIEWLMIHKALLTYARKSLSTMDAEFAMAMANTEPRIKEVDKRAAWVGIDEEPHEIWECNACGFLIFNVDKDDFKYCPNCGAKMEVDT